MICEWDQRVDPNRSGARLPVSTVVDAHFSFDSQSSLRNWVFFSLFRINW